MQVSPQGIPHRRGDPASEGLGAPAPSDPPGGWPALRRDGPGRRPAARAAPPDLSTDALRTKALESLDEDMYAASSRPAIRSRRQAVAELLRPWNLEPFPLTPAKVLRLAASLKAGGYRSASSVLSQYRVDAERRGDLLDGPVARAFADAGRSCRRGLGPVTKARPLPLERFAELPATPVPWVTGGPLGSRNALVVGAWWMARETELANARAALATITVQDGVTAELVLPATKADLEALGVSRAHGCTCGHGPPRADCPAHALWDQLLLLRRAFGSRHAGGSPDRDLPLFPTRDGQPVSKAAMAATIVEGARLLGVPTSNADQTERVSGHSLRPTGAQSMARMGVDTWSIQLLGRWGSAAVHGYIREAAVSAAAARARSAYVARGLSELVAEVGAAAPTRESSELTEQKVREIVAGWWPTAQRGWRASLVAEVLDAVSRAPPARSESRGAGASSSTSSSSSTSGAPSTAAAPAPPPAAGPADTVSSAASGKRHKVLVGPPTLAAAAWVTACGWRFGRYGLGRPSEPADAWCAKCFRF